MPVMKTETDEERGVKISTSAALDLLGRFQKIRGLACRTCNF